MCKAPDSYAEGFKIHSQEELLFFVTRVGTIRTIHLNAINFSFM